VTREIVTHALSWILYAQEPLTVEALLTATAIGSGRHALTPEGILDSCRGFIHLDSQSRIVRFDHQSVRSFLQSQTLFLPQQAQTLIALSCLRILKEPPLDNPIDLHPTRRPYDYALLYFGHHVSTLDAHLIHDSTIQCIEDFLFDQLETGLYTTIWLEHARATYDSLPRSHSQKAAMDLITSESSSPLFPICVFNMIYVLRNRAWPLMFDWDQRNKSGHTALYAASYFGHAEVIKLLLNHHVDPNVECGRLGSALQCAAYRGHDDVVRVLLGRGADPKLKRHFESAVHAACNGNNEDTVMALLQGGFDISTQDQYDSFESEIAKAGLARAMTELQSHPLSAKVPNRNVQLAAQMIASGEVNGLNYLLRKSISANGIPPGSLAISAGNGHENMTTFLIDQGVSVNEAGDLGTPLRCASIKGHNSICNILLSRGANVDESGPFGSALQAAAMRGHLHTAKLLLDMGADVNIRGGHYGTPLQAAAYHGHPELVQLLLAAKADVHIAGFSKDALHAAAEGGRHGVVQLFLDAGFQPLAPIRYFGPAFSRTGPPPPNLLRDSSPGRHKERKPRREKEHTDSIAPLDPLDLASGVTAYVPIKFKDRERAHQEYNYMLEAGAALNHLDVVATILSSAERPSEEGDDAAQLALMAACRHGHVGIVEMMINDMYCRRIELRKPLREATLRGHGVIVRTLLDRLLEMEPPSKDLFSDTLRTSIPGSPRIFDETLQSMKRALPPHDVQSTLSKCLPELANAGWVGTVKTTLQECTTITSGRLTYAFKRACDAGMTTVASTIYFEASQHARPVSTPQLVRRTRAAAQDGYKDLLQFLLSKCNEAGLEIQTREMICLAAGDGMLEIMTVLLTWSAKRHPTNLLDIALAVGAQNGHQEVCAFLMSQGANPFHGVWVLRRSHVAIKRRKIRAPRKVRKHRDSLEQATSSSGSEPGSDNDDDSESAYGPIAFKPSTVKHDAVQSCLAGFKRFNRHGSVYGGNRWLDLWSSTDVLENEVAQTRTLRTLLDGIANFDEKHWSHKLCTAARSCSPEVLEILLQKGVNARSAMKHENLLQAAAVRERQNHPIMQLLLQAGADQDLEDFDLRNILASSLAQFDDSPRSAGLFPAVQSLEELFVTGCGAVVEYLLGRLPFEDASGNGYAVLLQTAAAAGRLGLVKLLIARNIDVNATGSHYGTALQAVCRFVHTDVAEALLQAGADPNLIQGEYCTALRAAVVSESLPMVLLLLQFKADTELTGKASQPTALYLTVREKKHADIAFALLDAGASVKDASTGADEYLPRLLGSACDWGDCSVVRRLIEAGADLQASCAGRRYRNANTSAMHTAISRGHHDVVQLLLYHGFDLTAAFPNSDDFVTFAVRTEDAALITTILRHIPRRDDTLLLQASVAAIEHNLPGPLGQLLDAMQDVTSSALLELCRTACRTPNESTVELLLDRFSLVKNESITSSVIGAIDVRELRAELFDIWLLFFPYSIELFVEACIRGDIALVQRGIDFGHRPDSEDKWARSPFHLAAAQGRTSVVQRLLETGTDVNRVHVTYGTALVTALEGLSADKLIRKSSNDPDRSYATELAELENLKCSDFVYTNSSMLGFWRPSMRKVPFSKPRTVRASATEYGKTVSLLLSNGARADNPPGRFGTALTLAAFAGLIETFDTLIIHGAKINEAGGVLGSCLSAAIDQHHTILVDRLLSMASRSQSISDTEEFALHRACETCNLQIVVKLLELGYRPDTEDSERRTPLKIALAKLGRTYDVLPNTERIVHILMDADTRPILSADELQAAASVTSSPVQDRILDRILDNIITSVPQYKMPEESIIRLLETQKCTSFIEKLLDKKAVTPITTAMLASVYDVEIFPLLLEYDPSYVVTSATIDAIQTGRKEDANEMVEMLFLRSTSLQPTESQMCRAVAAERSYNSEYSQPDKPCLLDLMFTRNSDLHVTQDMLESVRNPTDLGVLLAHVPPGKHVVTDRVLEALTPIFETDEQGLIKFDHLKQRHREELLRIFLDFEPSAEVSPEIAQQFLTKCKLDTLERLLNHDNSIVMLPENVSSMIDSVDDSYDRAHGRFIEMLRKHPDQYEMSDEVKTNVDSRFRQHSEKHLKEMYYKFAGWMDVNEQKREMSEVS
jgi:ankyrin repeat protein